MLVSGAAPPLLVRLFGPFEVRLQGQPLRPLRTHKGERLLALLALKHEQPVERAWLAGSLWPESSPTQGADNLRRTLTDLRQALGPEAGRITAPSSHTLGLCLAGAAVDLLAFDAAIARGDPASLTEAVALYRGPLLEGCAEEWLLLERRAREEAYLKALETLAGEALTQGHPHGAVEYLRRALAVDPLREAALRALLQALAAGGEQAAATQTYREFRLLLYRELNAVPDPETEALFQELQARARQPLSDPRAAPPSERRPLRSGPACHGSLPRPLTALIGREQEVAALKAWLARERLVTITGAGGVGKTRLAIQVAQELRAEYPEGAWFVDLAPLSEPVLVAKAVATVLGVQEQPQRSLAETLAASLADKQMLLVLDNCEHLIQECAALAAALVSACPELRVLATSRRALGITGEVIWRAPSLSLPAPVESSRCSVERPATADPSLLSTLNQELSTFARSEAVALFVARAGAASPGFALTGTNAPVVAEVCRRLDGIPLALEMAAARVRALPVEQIAARLDERFRLLTTGSRTAPARQQTLQATMDWSYRLLGEKERALLRRLSVFAGGCTLEAAEAVCAGGAVGCRLSAASEDELVLGESREPTADSPREVLELLTQLVDHSLVLYAAEQGEERYWLLETVRQYGQERLGKSGEEAAVRARQLQFFLRLAEGADTKLAGPQQGEALDQLEREHDNLRAALTWASASGAASAGLRLAVALQGFWHIRGYWNEGREWLTRLLALPAGGRRNIAAGGIPSSLLCSVRAKALHGAAILADRQRDAEAAQALSEESLAIWRALGDERGIANGLDSLGWRAQKRQDWSAARALHEESLAIRRRLGDTLGITSSLHHLAMLALEEGDYTASRELHAECLTLCQQTGNRLGSSLQLFELGNLAYLDGDYLTARAFHSESLAIRREIGDKFSIAWSLHYLGEMARSQGDDEAAAAHYQESLALLRELEDRLCTAGSLVALGYVMKAQGDYPQAAALLLESLILHRELGEQRLASISLGGLAGVIAAAGHPARAARLFGAVDGLREAHHYHLWPADRTAYERDVAATSASLGEVTFTAAYEAGRTLSWEEAIADALREPGNSSGVQPPFEISE